MAHTQVNWKYMDNKLLEKFWQSADKYKAMRTTLPDCMAVSGQAASAGGTYTHSAGWG